MAHKEPPSSLLLVRGNNRRVAILVIGILSLLAMFFLTFSPHLAIHHCGHSEQQRSMVTETMSFSSGNTNDGEVSRRQARFTDLNDLTATSQAARNEEHVLILTPLKNAEAYLPRYFEMVNRLQYPHHLISLGFLVSDTTDRTVQLLQDRADEILNRDPPDDDSSSNNTRYHSVSIFEKDFDFELPEDRRHEFEMQPLRRSFMARARNYLLSAALKDEHAWVLWLDVDVIDYPASILTDLQSIDVDVVVPNCLRQTDENQSMGYDKNNWMETQQSLDMQKKLDPDYVLLEGYFEFLTGRYLMVDMPTHLGKLDKVPLDGVGATFTLVKAKVHREGANFPPFAFQHQVETEGFAKMAKAMGFGVYGLPSYLIYHIMNS